MKNSTFTYPNKRYRDQGSTLPAKTHISFKSQERGLLVMEEELMDHYKMNRSDLHKFFIRSAYNMLRTPQVGF